MRAGGEERSLGAQGASLFSVPVNWYDPGWREDGAEEKKDDERCRQR